MTEMEKLRRDAVKYKALYPAGTRIILLDMQDRHDPVPADTMGTVMLVDAASNIHVDWDNGRTLSICPQIDDIRGLNADERDFDQSLMDFIKNKIPNIKGWSDLAIYTLPNPEYTLVIFADKISEDDDLEYIIEPNRTVKGKQIQCGNSGECEFHDPNKLLRECRRVIANTFPNSCRKKP